MEVRLGIKKSVWEKEMRYEGYAIIDGIKKELTPELLKELQQARKEGKIKDYVRYWINDAGNPIDIL